MWPRPLPPLPVRGGQALGAAARRAVSGGRDRPEGRVSRLTAADGRRGGGRRPQQPQQVGEGQGRRPRQRTRRGTRGGDGGAREREVGGGRGRGRRQGGRGLVGEGLGRFPSGHVVCKRSAKRISQLVLIGEILLNYNKCMDNCGLVGSICRYTVHTKIIHG